MKAKVVIISLALAVIGALASTACGQFSITIETPTPADVAAVPTDTPGLRPTVTPIASPSPTSTATPAAPATERPAPFPPLPKPEDVARRYAEEIRPLIEKLQMAQKPPPGFQPPELAQCQIILVPLSERLFYIQEILFAELRLGRPDAAVRLHITYDYERGGVLGWLGISAETQAVISEVRLIAEEDGKFYLIEGKEGVGGSGCSSYRELVSKSVEKLDSLGDLGEQVENVLETIIGYAAGLDWDNSFPINQRLAVLMWALTSENWADRKCAAEALGGIGSKEGVVPALIKALGDEDWPVREGAAWALGRIGPEPGVVHALIKALGDENDEVRRATAMALGRIGPEAKEAVPTLIEALGDEDSLVRQHAAGALGDMGPEAAEEVVPALIETLGDEDSSLRRVAAWALGNIGPEAKEAVPTLIEALGDEDSSVRQHAAGALGDMGPEAKEAIPALIEALGDEDSSVHRNSAGALKAITEQDFGEDAARWQEWWEAQE